MQYSYKKLKFSSWKVIFIFLLLASVVGMPGKGYAQLNPLGQMYFQNQYLANPAMAGLNSGVQVNFAYRQQWISMPDAPIAQSFTAQYGFASKIGVGLNVFNDKASILRRTNALGSVAYHLPLGANGQSMSFGVSAGVTDEALDPTNAEDLADISVSKFNDRGAYFDGDIGLAYVGNGLTIQASVPNVRSLHNVYQTENLINRPTFFSAISYKTKINISADVNPLGVEPKLVYRGVDGFEDLIDVGANFTLMEEKVQVLAMYHSTQNITLGLGFQYKSLGINAMHTTKSYDLRQMQTSNFEVGLQYSFWNNK